MTPRSCRRCAVQPLVNGHIASGAHRHDGRGLCHLCYQVLNRGFLRGDSDELLDYPRTTRTNEDMIEDYLMLAGRGCTKRQAAALMDVSFAALDMALVRWRRKQRAAA